MLFRVLGPLEIWGSGKRPVDVTAVTAEKQRLLVLLLLRANTWVDTDTIVGGLWPDHPPASARSNVKAHVHQLRQLLPRPIDGSPRINSRSGDYRLNIARTEIDAAVFEDLTTQGLAALAAGNPTTAVSRLNQALALWRGVPYGSLGTELAASESTRLLGLRWQARDALADALLAIGKPGEAVTLLRPLCAEDPLREPTWHRLLLALHAAGRRADALAAYEQARQALVDELGVEAGPELQQLHERILAADSAESAESVESAELTVVIPLISDGPEGPDGPGGRGGPDAGSDVATPAARPGTVPPPDVRRPAANEDLEPWSQWRVDTPQRTRLRIGVLLAVLMVLAAATVLGVAAWTSGGTQLLGSPAPAGDATAGPTSTSAAAPAVAPRRPVPGIPGPAAGGPKLLFGVGDQADRARQTELVKNTPARMLSTWYRGSDDLPRLRSWRESVIKQSYADGFALHLIVTVPGEPSTFDTRHGRACGKQGPMTNEFLKAIQELAAIFAGDPGSPPLYVTVFDQVQTFACNPGGYRPDPETTAYYKALKERYLRVRELFHRGAPNALVSLGWGGWLAGTDDPVAGSGASMLKFFNEVMSWSDFQSFSAVETDGNVEDVLAMVRALGQYGPVMLASYGPWNDSAAVFEADVRALLTDERLAELTSAGLFGWSFTDDATLTASPSAGSFVSDAVRRYARPAS